MAPPDVSRSYIPHEPFRFVGGHVAADLVNTVNWERAGLDRDRLSDYGRVLQWAEEVGVIDRAAAVRLLAAALVRPAKAEKVYRASRHLRGIVQRLLTVVGRDSLGTAEGASALADFNELLARALKRMRLDAPAKSRHAPPDASIQEEPNALSWNWEGADSRLDAPLWPVIWATAQLLASPEVAQLRVCEGVDCGWIYLDHSRNGLRRWCEMQTCGTREKSRRRAERQKAG
jgi:predicted RNA-binding Zn ribbon-like protein